MTLTIEGLDRLEELVRRFEKAAARLAPGDCCVLCGDVIPDGHACVHRSDGGRVCLGCEDITP